MGVVFLVVVPTEKFEKKLRNEIADINAIVSAKNYNFPVERNQLNIQPSSTVPPPQPTPNVIVKAEVELRHKNVPPAKKNKSNPVKMMNIAPANVDVSMFKILSDLLIKLEVEHVTWTHDKLENYFQVIFPAASGERTETILHCLIELGIGKRYNSSVNILPASVSYDATNDNSNEDDFDDEVENSKWNSFVESIKSKLTVKQVVDGVRGGGSLTFDYLLLIVTADSLAALGLVENNASNIVAAMLVSPLMGPVMSITFGTIISDWQLVRIGIVTLLTGMFISLLFGFIFGLILGTTEMPWGFGDFPTEEMKGRGNARSLWMGVLWALTSGSGVAIALLQGSVGPLVGVAISASLLPPVVNCGLFWALACIWLQYEDKKIPHIKGEAYTLHRGNTSYQFIYTDYIPTEFFINGIISCTLTVVNVICIFITAIIVLKIKEVAAPYTSSPDLRRFWETDIREARRTNTLRRKNSSMFGSSAVNTYEDLMAKSKTLGSSLEQALREATDDATLKRIKRVSYSVNAAPEVDDDMLPHSSSSDPSTASPKRNSKDIELLEKLMKNLLDQKSPSSTSSSPNASMSGIKKLRPLSRQLSRSLRLGSFKRNNNNTTLPTISESGGSGRRNVLNTIRNAPQRFSSADGEESKNLTRNILE